MLVMLEGSGVRDRVGMYSFGILDQEDDKSDECHEGNREMRDDGEEWRKG